MSDFEKELKISWDRFHEDCQSLAVLVKETGDFDAILAITRGGLIPAGILSILLNIRIIDTISIESYQGKERGSHIIHKYPILKSGKIIAIDDLSDTGTTFNIVKEEMPFVTTAAVYSKPAGESSVEIFAVPIAQECWIHFPWEE